MSQKSTFDKSLDLVLGSKTHSAFNFIKTDAAKGVPGSVWESYQTSHNQPTEYSIIQPSQAPAEAVFASSNAYTEFLFNPNKSRLVQVLLDFKIKAAALTSAVASHRLIERIEYYSGSTLLANYDSTSLWAFQGLTRTPAEHTEWQTCSNMDDLYAGRLFLSAG